MRPFPVVDVMFFDTGLDSVFVEDHYRIGVAFPFPRLNRHATRQPHRGGEHYEKAYLHRALVLVEQRGQFIAIALLI